MSETRIPPSFWKGCGARSFAEPPASCEALTDAVCEAVPFLRRPQDRPALEQAALRVREVASELSGKQAVQILCSFAQLLPTDRRAAPRLVFQDPALFTVLFTRVSAQDVNARTVVPLAKAYRLMQAPAPGWLLPVATRVPELGLQPHGVVEVIKVTHVFRVQSVLDLRVLRKQDGREPTWQGCVF